MLKNQQSLYEFHVTCVWRNKQYKYIDKLQNHIYIAEDLQHNNRKIIIKQITDQYKKYREREKQITKDLIRLYKSNQYNPQIIEYYDLFEEDDSTYIVMQLCDSDLYEYYQNKLSKIQKNTQFYCKVLSIIRQIIEGYQYLIYSFGSGFLHRDLKPQNILLVDNQFKICDFGLSKNTNENPTKRIGTQKFQAPEMYGDNTYDNKCDIYSLGILLLWLLTGQYSKDYISQLNLNFQDLLTLMLDDDPIKRISWKQLFKHPVFVKEPIDFLETERLNQTSITFQDLSQIIQFADLDSTQSSFSPKVITSFIKQSNYVQQLELNKLISDTFKHVDESNLELTRILFALWIKIYDQEILQEKDELRRREYHKLKLQIQNQQLIRIKTQVDYRIEFLSIKELCHKLSYHMEHFKNDEDLKNRLENFLKNKMNQVQCL
ncbi:unnamed protein product [Paramecium pentaurelia]|uniref:Protein kinase domain-containing protein n=1 Tax=Paramecium pentaurelia TaxID=43138 RepID=A0A8S1VDU7_9CILI|nr:unnamed protein product [Paramecium pentaurelia]